MTSLCIFIVNFENMSRFFCSSYTVEIEPVDVILHSMNIEHFLKVSPSF